jgi:hypothetical protein
MVLSCSAAAPTAVLPPPVVLLKSAPLPFARVGVGGGVASKQ